MAEYNGYYNYNVWNIMLWVDNESDLYNQKVRIFDAYYNDKLTYKQFMSKINQLGGATKQRSDVKGKLTKTEIEELRKEFRAQYKEYKEYRDKHGKY